MRLQVALCILIAGLCSLADAQPRDSSSNVRTVRNRNNLFDPIFAYDENDAHTVSASISSQQPIEKRDRTPIYQELDANEPELTSFGRLPIKPIDYLEAAKRQQAAASMSELVAKKEEPKHWSALENYYQKLRSASGGSQKTIDWQPQPQFQPRPQSNQELPIYQVLQQELDEPLAGYKPIESHRNYLPTLQRTSILSNAQPTGQAFNLPVVSSRPANSDPDFGFATVHHNAAPGISRVNVLSQPPPANLEWRKLPEMLLLQQQQERVKHQQETFGSWYDHQRSKELLQEEAFCGPRNYISSRVADLVQSRLQLSPVGTELPIERFEAAVGEFPSHMGVYNGTKPGEDNFICAATWIHEKFAVTLASCVGSLDPAQLSVRAGEWNLNKNQSREAPLIVRQVEEVLVFPKYRNDSLEHNLALLKFAKPLEYLNLAYVCPACQRQSRSAIRTNFCWTPVRNTTISEYFDAEGEGETKEKKNARMVELPVRLIANDDVECQRQTKVQLFNIYHPNYICSDDIRTSRWRQQLNQTDYFGSGIYCNEESNLSLVAIVHPIRLNTSSAFGYLDLSYYRPWMRKVIFGHSY